jgi:hypothetical protein
MTAPLSIVVSAAMATALLAGSHAARLSPPRNAVAQPQATLDSTLRGLEFMLGAWGAPPSVTRVPPNRVVHHYMPMVGGKSLRVREGFPQGRSDDADLDGMVYWNAASQRIEFVAVAGKGTGQGRFFTGEYRVHADGSIEREYDVYYRSLADTPGEELGGSRRRYRESYRAVGKDSVEATLDWWLAGRWQPFGPGKYLLIRKAS